MEQIWNTILDFLKSMGFAQIFVGENWKCLIMILVACILLYLAIVKKFEPLLLVPIGFGMLLTNLPGAGLFHEELFAGGHVNWELIGDTSHTGLLDYLYLGVKLGIYPCLIFMGVGAMTDFGPLIANPKSLLLGAAAQLGIYVAFTLSILVFQLPFMNSQNTAIQNMAASIGIIGGADGPTAILVTSQLAPAFLGPIAVAAYSYMALVPVIQPPIMKALTTKEERAIRMQQLRPVSKTEKIIFPISVLMVCAFLLPSATPLIGALMFGNLIKECGVTGRLADTASNALMNTVTIFLGLSVGSKMEASHFLTLNTLGILLLGAVAFSLGTAMGVLIAKLMNRLDKRHPVNPLIGSAGVSAVPMAARVASKVGQEADPQNFLLMHAMGPNVSGVIGSAVAAGVLMAAVPNMEPVRILLGL